MTIKAGRAQSIAFQLKQLRDVQIPNAKAAITRIQASLAALQKQGAPSYEIDERRRYLADWVRGLATFRRQAAGMRTLLKKRGPRY